MKQNKRKELFQRLLPFMLTLILPQMASAYDLMVNGIAYNIVSSANKTLEVTSRTSSSAGSDGSTNYSGNVVIGEKVYYSGAYYTVIGIGEQAFKNSFISSLKLPETLTYIKKEAFTTCFSLSELSIPASVTEIGASCFWMCPDLTKVYSYATTPPTCTGTNVFSYMQYNNATLYVPDGCLSQYKYAYGWKDFPNFMEMAPMINGHEYVDLQLPSGKLWATMNYGASSVSDYGTYVVWSSNDIVKNSWGNNWATPTIEDIKELIYNCSWSWSYVNGKTGYTVIGNNGKSIFLPAAGIEMGSVMKTGEWCYYWSSTQQSSNMVYILLSTASDVWYGSLNTITNVPIRPVASLSPTEILATGITLNKSVLSLVVGKSESLVATVTPSDVTNGSVTWSSSNPTVASVSSSGVVTANAAGSAVIKASTTDGTNLSAFCNVTVISTTAVTGDVNNDGEVSIADINAVIDAILTDTVLEKADVNGDGEISIADINAIIDIILNPQPQNRSFTVNGVSFTMVAVEGGSFMMGATSEQGSDAQSDEYPVHKVTLSSFLIGQTEVTQELWVAVMGNNPSRFSGHMDRPVEDLSWNDCQTFITKLNKLTGMTFRLPTEAEWEFAARGGNKSLGYKYSGSDDIDEIAWYGVVGGDWLNPKYGTHTVGSLAPNELGLYDMTGNVWEWCQDKYGEYSAEDQTNPIGAEAGSRIHRGGAWDISASQCRVSYRKMCTLYTSFYIGLRLAL